MLVHFNKIKEDTAARVVTQTATKVVYCLPPCTRSRTHKGDCALLLVLKAHTHIFLSPNPREHYLTNLACSCNSPAFRGNCRAVAPGAGIESVATSFGRFSAVLCYRKSDGSSKGDDCDAKLHFKIRKLMPGKKRKKNGSDTGVEAALIGCFGAVTITIIIPSIKHNADLRQCIIFIYVYYFILHEHHTYSLRLAFFSSSAFFCAASASVIAVSYSSCKQTTHKPNQTNPKSKPNRQHRTYIG